MSKERIGLIARGIQKADELSKTKDAKQNKYFALWAILNVGLGLIGVGCWYILHYTFIPLYGWGLIPGILIWFCSINLPIDMLLITPYLLKMQRIVSKNIWYKIAIICYFVLVAIFVSSLTLFITLLA